MRRFHEAPAATVVASKSTHSFTAIDGQRLVGRLQPSGYVQRRRYRIQQGDDVEHMWRTDRPAGCSFQRQFHRHQRGVQARPRHDGQHLCHHPVTTRVAHQRPGHVDERRAVTQCDGLALDQRDVVLPVVLGLATVADNPAETRPRSC